jgi:hypothetical protein
METDTPIGFLQGAGGVSTQIQTILEAAGARHQDNPVLFSEDADELIADITKALDRENTKYRHIYHK